MEIIMKNIFLFILKFSISVKILNILNLLVLKKQKFKEVNIENTAILRELHKMEPFNFIPNPGNLGDILLLKATIDFFDQYKIQYRFWNGKSKSENIVYGGGGIWIPNYKHTWIKVLPIFLEAKKVLILPSSFYECLELIEILDDRFVIFCREEKSYMYMKKKCN